MAYYISFKKIVLPEGMTIDDWLNTYYNEQYQFVRFTFYNHDKTKIMGEAIGDKRILDWVEESLDWERDS